MLRMTNKHSARAGFTLIELIVATMLIIFLTAATISGLVRSQRTFTFNGADQQVGSLVRQARSLAVTGKAVPDFYDYDGDGLRDDVGDFVTPANYGVYFDSATNTLTLFADLHAYSGGGLTEGVYDEPSSGGGIGQYELNKDLKLAEYVVPPTLSLLSKANDASGVNTVMYSPIFADTAFANDMSVVDLKSDGLFFIFGLREKPPFARENCFAIHPIAGVPETTAATGTSCP